VAEFLGLAGSKFKVRVSSICRGPPPGYNTTRIITKVKEYRAKNGRAGIFKHSMGARNIIGIGLSFRPPG
jgi:hypothetical protein